MSTARNEALNGARHLVRKALRTSANKPAPPFAVLRAALGLQELVRLTFDGRYRLDLVEIDGVGDEYPTTIAKAIKKERETPR